MSQAVQDAARAEYEAARVKWNEATAALIAAREARRTEAPAEEYGREHSPDLQSDEAAAIEAERQAHEAYQKAEREWRVSRAKSPRFDGAPVARALHAASPTEPVAEDEHRTGDEMAEAGRSRETGPSPERWHFAPGVTAQDVANAQNDIANGRSSTLRLDEAAEAAMRERLREPK